MLYSKSALLKLYGHFSAIFLLSASLFNLSTFLGGKLFEIGKDNVNKNIAVDSLWNFCSLTCYEKSIFWEIIPHYHFS